MDATQRLGETFSDVVLRLRAEYNEMKARSNLIPPLGRFPAEEATERVDGHLVESFWFEDSGDATTGAAPPSGDVQDPLPPPPKTIQYVRLHDLPGTLSGDILRLRRDLPAMTGHYEIEGNMIRPLAGAAPEPPTYPPDYDADVGELVARLPVVEVDPTRHFTKRPKYRSEITHHLLCQGGTCAGSPPSPHLTRLLGRSCADDDDDGGASLVFDRLLPRYLVLPRFSTAGVYRTWLLHLLDGLQALHALGIVHRDIHLENVLFADDGRTLVLADLEGRWGQRGAPEITQADTLDSAWTVASDVFDIGRLVQCLIYANVPIKSQVEWPVPYAFQRVVDACRQANPEDRPSIQELRIMVQEITCDEDKQ